MLLWQLSLVKCSWKLITNSSFYHILQSPVLSTPKKKLNGLHGEGKQRKSPVAVGAGGGVAGGSGGPNQQSTPLNFSGKSSPGSASTPDSGKKRPGGGGLYRPYSTSPTPSKHSPGNI